MKLNTYIIFHFSLFIIAFLIAYLTLFPKDSISSDYVYIKKIIDGDTAKISNDQFLRYIGIDAPERNERYYNEAKEFNRKLAEGKKVRLEYDIVKYDNHNRLLAYVYTEDGKCLNEELLKNGLAYMYPHPFETLLFNKLLEAQKYAIIRGIGIWKYALKDSSTFYIGSKKGMRFHKPNCPWAEKINKKNKVIFNSKKEAFYQGFAPCRRCKP